MAIALLRDEQMQDGLLPRRRRTAPLGAGASTQAPLASPMPAVAPRPNIGAPAMQLPRPGGSPTMPTMLPKPPLSLHGGPAGGGFGMPGRGMGIITPGGGPTLPPGGPHIMRPPPNVGVTPGVPPAAPDTGPITDFGPGDDLRFTQINPMDDARTSRLSDLVEGAAGRIGGAPDITQAGLDKLKLFEDETADARRLGTQEIGRRAAALGRVGSGMVTTDLGNLEDRLQTRLARERAGLAADLTMQEAGDRRANAGVLGTLQDQIFGQGAQRRNELRGERGYQYGVAGDAENAAIRRRLIEEDLRDRSFGRNVQAAQLGLEGAGQYDAGAADSMGSASDLAQMLAYFNASGMGRRRTRPPDATITGDQPG